VVLFQIVKKKLWGGEIKRLVNDDVQALREGSRDFDAEVQADTGANSFECLALQVAFVESRIQQCGSEIGREFQQDRDPLYCDNSYGETLQGDDGASLGIMQINTDAHPRVDVTDFEVNVRFGAILLINNYDSNSMTYVCNSRSYSGWQRALRGYNGWNTDCSRGNPNYVEDVRSIKNRADFTDLFPECG